MAIDKSIRQHYETQAGVKNFLGKQKMVKAPKYWLSKPGHVKAKLAYITDEEEQILIDKNLYGSLRGRPNKGPAGLPSLQGGDFGSGRSDSGSRNGGNGSHDRGGGQHRAAAQRAAPAPSPHRDDSAERAAQAAADALNAAREAEARESAREKAIQVAALTPKPLNTVRFHSADTPLQIAEQKEIDDWGFQDAKAKAPTTLVPRYEEVTKGVPFLEDPITQKQRHYYSPIGSQLQPTGFGSKGDKTWHEAAEAGIKRGSGLGTLGKIALTALTAGAGAGVFGKDIANIAKAAKWVGRGRDIRTALDTGKLNILGKEFNLSSNLRSTIDKAKAAKFRDERTTLGKEDIENWERKQDWSAVKPPKEDGENVNKTTLAKQVAGGENVIAQAINQYRGTEAEAQIANLVKTNLNKALQYYSMMTPKIEAGKANKQEMDAYELLGYYLNEAAPKQQNLAYGGRIDKALGGRSRDI